MEEQKRRQKEASAPFFSVVLVQKPFKVHEKMRCATTRLGTVLLGWFFFLRSEVEGKRSAMHILEPFLLPFLSVHLLVQQNVEKNAIRTVNEVVSSDLGLGKKLRFVQRLIGLGVLKNEWQDANNGFSDNPRFVAYLFSYLI